MSGLWIAVYAVCGAIGAAVGAAAAQFADKQKNAVRVAITVATMLSLAALAKPHVARYEATKAMDEIPAFAELKRHEPETWERMRDGLAEAVRAGGGRAAIQSRTRILLGQIVEKYLPTASDEAIVKYVGIFIEEVEQAQRKDPKIAYAMLFPERAKPFDITEYVDESTRNRDVAALAEIIRTGARNEAGLQVDTHATELLTEIVQTELAPKYGEELALLDKAGQPGTNEPRTVEILLDLYNAILERPTSDAAQVLRFMFRDV